MAFVLLLIGALFVVAAIRGTQGLLFSSLMKDTPEYIVWGAAIVAIGAIGFVPGLKIATRMLLALVFLSIFLVNYKTIIAGLESVSTPVKATGQTQTGGTFEDFLKSLGVGG